MFDTFDVATNLLVALILPTAAAKVELGKNIGLITTECEKTIDKNEESLANEIDINFSSPLVSLSW